MRGQFDFDDAPRRGEAPWQRSDEQRYHDRSRQFFVGAALALAAGAMVLPAYVFLIHAPRFAHAPVVGGVMLPVLILIGAAGVWSLVRCVRDGPFDVLTALAFGVLLIVFVLVVYTGVLAVAVMMQGR